MEEKRKKARDKLRRKGDEEPDKPEIPSERKGQTIFSAKGILGQNIQTDDRKKMKRNKVDSK